MKKACNYWLVDCLTIEEAPELIGIVCTKPVTVAEVIAHVENNTTLSIIDIWTSDPEELEFAGVEVLRIS